jgi:glycosidase
MIASLPHRWKIRAGKAWLALLLAATAPAVPAAVAPPATDWRDQILYFVMTDRFEDGDPGNNDQHAGEFAAGDPARYNGGDLRGITQRLDYIRGLGVTGVWITPPVANLWWNAKARYGGYHGYWAEDFKAVDAHLGTLADYQELSRRLHGAGMVLVQDIVLNHTGSWFDYEGGWDAADPLAHFQLTPDSRGRSAPSQWPFSLNDVRRAEDRAAGIYHWTPDVRDYNDAAQVLTFQMGGLDDLNSESPLVRQALRQSYDHWIRAVGVDGFRIDTAFYVPREALDDFLYAEDAEDPGVMLAARAAGRPGFHVFGEGFATDKPYEDTQARRIDALMHRDDGSPLLPGMLNFPLYASIGDVFARGRPTAEMAWRIGSMMRVHEQPELMPSFLDNHDVDRFLAGGSEAGLKQGLLLMMTLPGIPTIYYGTEQAFSKPRAAMFKAGSDSGGRDHFDTGAPLYRYIQAVTGLRRGHRLFSRGRPTVLKANAAGPGVLAYRMDHAGEAAIVVFNSSDGEVLLDNLDTGLDAGVRLAGLFDMAGPAQDLRTGRDGGLSLKLPARSGKVWLVTEERAPVAPARAGIELDDSSELQVSGDFDISGSARGVRQFQLVPDGELAAAVTVRPGADGRWSARVDTSRMIDPRIRHQIVAWSAAPAAVSAARSFQVKRQWQNLVDVADPVGDDDGPGHRYVYPEDPGWRAQRQLDLQQVRIAGSGGAMKISLRMNSITTPWNPPNGFDHVAFAIYVQIPGRAGGSTVMPLQNGELPAGMRWHYRLRAHGWSNALFSADGAAAGNEGRPTTPAAAIEVDAADRSISFTLSGAALGGIDSLSGVKVYVSTWDFDGGMRPLTVAAGATSFGGGDGARDPLVMDDSGIITLP